jgi:hypothetical protein
MIRTVFVNEYSISVPYPYLNSEVGYMICEYIGWISISDIFDTICI